MYSRPRQETVVLLIVTHGSTWQLRQVWIDSASPRLTPQSPIQTAGLRVRVELVLARPSSQLARPCRQQTSQQIGLIGTWL